MAKRWILGVGILVVGGAALVLVLAARQRELVRESHTVAEAIRRVSKLSTVEMNLSNWQLRRDAKQLFGFLPFKCEKTVAVFYRGKVAAGFELAPDASTGLTLNVDGRARRVQVQLPAPQILYTDVPAPQLVIADGSLCNKLTPEDYTRLHEDARAAVQREAINSGVLGRAETHARELIGEIVRPFGYELDLRVGAPRAPVDTVAEPRR